jgi:hypothetical protein
MCDTVGSVEVIYIYIYIYIYLYIYKRVVTVFAAVSRILVAMYFYLFPRRHSRIFHKDSFYIETGSEPVVKTPNLEDRVIWNRGVLP